MAKSALVTGAGRGIGLEITKILVAQGHTVVATSRTLTPELKAVGCETMSLDVSSDMKELRERAARFFPNGLDILINNAGTFAQENGFESVDPKQVVQSFEVNAVGCLKVTQALLPSLKKSLGAVVVNVTSRMGSIDDNSSGGYYGYRMSKAALNMFNKSFAIDNPGITSIVIHPGWVKTRMGGAGAAVETKDSASGILKVMAGLSAKQTGKFFDFNGKEIPW